MPAAILVQDKHSDMILEEGHNSAELLANSKQQQARDTDVAITRFEQVRFRLARLGKSRSLHEVFERSRHFYFPQRLWIAFSVSNVGIVFILAVYMFGVKAACIALAAFRIQIMTLLALINGFVGAAPAYLELMLGNTNALQGAAGGLHLCWLCMPWLTL